MVMWIVIVNIFVNIIQIGFNLSLEVSCLFSS